LSTVKSFEDLTVWKDARIFTNKIYLLTKQFPNEELYGLTSQIRRATVSIMSNIAEGFVCISRGSISEVQNDLFIAKDLKYINDDEFQQAYKYSKKLAMQLNGLIKYLRTNGKTFSKVIILIGNW